MTISRPRHCATRLTCSCTKGRGQDCPNRTKITGQPTFRELSAIDRQRQGALTSNLNKSFPKPKETWAENHVRTEAAAPRKWKRKRITQAGQKIAKRVSMRRVGQKGQPSMCTSVRESSFLCAWFIPLTEKSTKWRRSNLLVSEPLRRAAGGFPTLSVRHNLDAHQQTTSPATQNALG